MRRRLRCAANNQNQKQHQRVTFGKEHRQSMAILGKNVQFSWKTELRQALALRESGVFIALLVFFFTMVAVSAPFRSEYNLLNILKQISVTTIIATGQT